MSHEPHTRPSHPAQPPALLPRPLQKRLMPLNLPAFDAGHIHRNTIPRPQRQYPYTQQRQGIDRDQDKEPSQLPRRRSQILRRLRQVLMPTAEMRTYVGAVSALPDGRRAGQEVLLEIEHGEDAPR